MEKQWIQNRQNNPEKKKLEDKLPNVKTYYKAPVIKQINGTDQRSQKQTHTSADFQLKCQVNSIRKSF